MNLWHNLYGKILDSPEVAEIFRAVRDGENVAIENRERREALLVMWVLALENLVFQSRHNPFVEDIENLLAAVVDRNVAIFMASQSAREWVAGRSPHIRTRSCPVN